MRLGATIFFSVFLVLATVAAPLPGRAQTQQPAARPAAKADTDFRAAFRAQVEDELAQLRPRLKVAEDEGRQQSDRYKEMAASKADMARKAAEKTQATRTKTDAAAAKKGYTPKAPGKSAGAGKKAGATDAKADGGDKAKGGEGGAGGSGAAPKKVDPVLTQQYLVMGLRDQVRQLRDRITYLEGLLARL